MLQSMGPQRVKRNLVTDQHHQQIPQKAIIERIPRFSCCVPKENAQLQFSFLQSQKIRTGESSSLFMLEL